MKKTNHASPDVPRISRLWLGECKGLLSTIPDPFVDFVLTQPPPLGLARDEDGQALPDQLDDRWVLPTFAEIYRVMKPNSLCLAFYDWAHSDRMLSAWRGVGLMPVGHLVFVKDYVRDSSFLKRKHEQAILLAKGWPDVPKDRLVDVLPWKSEPDPKLTPDQQPIQTLRELIRAFTKPGQLVLDPFCGTGSTVLAAVLEGRRAVGIEKDVVAFKMARNRLSY